MLFFSVRREHCLFGYVQKPYTAHSSALSLSLCPSLCLPPSLPLPLPLSLSPSIPAKRACGESSAVSLLVKFGAEMLNGLVGNDRSLTSAPRLCLSPRQTAAWRVCAAVRSLSLRVPANATVTTCCARASAPNIRPRRVSQLQLQFRTASL